MDLAMDWFDDFLGNKAMCKLTSYDGTNLRDCRNNVIPFAKLTDIPEIPEIPVLPVVRQGTATLTLGIATVSNNTITANSLIFLTHQNVAGVAGVARVSGRNPGVSFTITSSSLLDTSKIAYQIFEPA